VFEIKLYGEVIPFADLQKEGFVNLAYLQKELQKASGRDVKVRINSVGGDVDEGFAMYSELRRYAKEKNAKITTLDEGRCASIAMIFFLAGDKRIVTEYTEPFVHNAWCYTMGDAKKVMRTAVDLEKCNDKIAKHYQQHTNLTYKQARELMEQETAISPQEAMAFRFATQIEPTQRPQAKQLIINKLKNNMTKRNPKNKKSTRSVIRAFKRALGFQNKIVFDATNRDVNFYELEDNDVVQIGDKATIDGQTAQGEVVMATGETYIFENGELIEIIEKSQEQNAEEPTQEVEVLEEKVEELEKENEELKEEIEALEEEKEELEEMLNKATSTISNMRKNLTEIRSKSVETRKNRPTRQLNTAKSVSTAVLNFKNNRLNSIKN